MNELLQRIREIGFEVKPLPPNIRVRWTKNSEPLPKKELVFPLLTELKKRKSEILQELLSETKPQEVSQKTFLQVKVIEAEAFAKGWLPEYLWRPRFVNLKDRLHECGLVYIMEPGEVIKAVTEQFIEIANKRGTILRFYKPVKAVKHESNT